MLAGDTFTPPSWAGKPPPGLHLDVTKSDKLIQKFMVDEKSYYLFGRNSKICDFVTDHASCSRIHAALVWHTNLERAFLIDLGSVHGTFIGSIRLEVQKPQQILIDSPIHFGASTRRYVLREKPQNLVMHGGIGGDSILAHDSSNLNILHELPEDETELENLTEFNTAHNRRIAASTALIGSEDKSTTKKSLAHKKYDAGSTLSALNPLMDMNEKLRGGAGKHNVRFSDREEVINPEDIDPSIGRYRNMVQTIIVPKASSDAHNPLALQKSKTLHPKALMGGTHDHLHGIQRSASNRISASLYYDKLIHDENDEGYQISTDLKTPPFAPRRSSGSGSTILPGKSGSTGAFKFMLPNPAPNIDINDDGLVSPQTTTGGKRKSSENEVTDISQNGGDNSVTTDQLSHVPDNDTSLLGPHSFYGTATAQPDQPAPETSVGPYHKKKKYAKEAWPGKRPNHSHTTASVNLPPTLLI